MWGFVFMVYGMSWHVLITILAPLLGVRYSFRRLNTKQGRSQEIERDTNVAMEKTHLAQNKIHVAISYLLDALAGRTNDGEHDGQEANSGKKA